MHKVVRSALMPYSARQMFDVVNDVASYPQFLPWCSASEVLHQTDTEMVARLDLSRGSIRQSFTTRNTLVAPESIDLTLVEGPFTSLDGRWRFTQLGEDGCRVDMTLSFDFDSTVMNFTLGKVFGVAADKLVDAFCDRADAIYR